MSISKPMREVSVEEMLGQFNLVVPEIQREYVWGFNQYGVFESFLEDLIEGRQLQGELSQEVKSLIKTIKNPSIEAATKKNLQALLENIQPPKASINIGFLYSYKPSYYIGNDREEDLYLIDGQQRFTTLVLLLFYFALRENRKPDFLQLLKFDNVLEKIAFDYRVRSITHQFFIELISGSNTVEDLLTVTDKQWFLEKFKNDVTVKSVTGNENNQGVFYFIHSHFESDKLDYYDFISKGIKFWHFKTEETSQGEELYITMNSRGQQLAENETVRARLFDSEEVKKDPLKWSEQWEIWQDFFWKHRNKKEKGVSADDGFNEFLRWVQILKMWEILYKGKTPSTDIIDSFENVLQWHTGSKLNIDYLNLADIELTFQALNYLYEKFMAKQNVFEKKYQRSHLKDLIPKSWVSTTGNTLTLIHVFQLLPILQYCKCCFKNKIEVDDLNLYRFIRTVKTLSKDRTIGKAVLDQVANVLYFSSKFQPNQDVTEILTQSDISKTILNDELVVKLNLCSTVSERERLEDLIWFAEDLSYNNGEISHLIKITESSVAGTQGFDIVNFENVVMVYDEFMRNENTITGNILHTDCYFETHDRIEYYGNWYKKMGLSNLIKLRILNRQQSLSDFLITQQKAFINEYSSFEDIFKENKAQRQLYIYYILTSNKIAASFLNWEWNDCYNFGKLNPESGKILFESGFVFQLFKSNFTINACRILEIHQFPFNSALQNLLAWAK